MAIHWLNVQFPNGTTGTYVFADQKLRDDFAAVNQIGLLPVAKGTIDKDYAFVNGSVS